MNDFIAHWGPADAALAPASLVVRTPENIAYTLAQFTTLRNTVQARQNTVQGCLADMQITRGSIRLQKESLLGTFHAFVSIVDGYYQATDFLDARPYAPTLNSGQEAFTRPMVDAMLLWEKLNAGPAPAGITLPLELGNGTVQSAFASAIAALQVTYALERNKAQELILARARRNRTQQTAYEIMKAYRESLPGKLQGHPDIIETMPRLTPLPGHTPEPVNASAVFLPPDAARVVYSESTDPQLERYELRGTIGEEYDEEDAVVLATHLPADPREFETLFGLNQPGTEIALKVFVILTTGNESGSATMRVARPAGVELAAAA